MARPGRRRLVGRAALLGALWLLLVVVGTVAHQQIWITAREGAEHERWKLSATNVLHIALFPGYFAKRILTGTGWGHGRIRSALFVNSLGWAFWISGAVILLYARRVCVRCECWPRVARIAGPPSASRRKFLTDAPLALTGVFPAAGAVYAGAIAPWDLRTVRYRVAIRDLPFALDGLRMVQLSDTHLGPRVPADYLRGAVERSVRLAPDVFLLTGDYVDGGTGHIERVASILGTLVATGRPVVGVLGNHDYYGDPRWMARTLAARGVHMIDNARVFLVEKQGPVLRDLPSGDALCIAGLADKTEDTIDADAAFRDVPPQIPRIVLEHNPDAAELPELTRGDAPRIDLMISGHTHGGQVSLPVIGPPVIPSQYGRKYAGGLVRGPAFPVLISRGIGLAILPVRCGVPPEVIEITLTRA